MTPLLVKPKREWRCSGCGATYIKFWGSCKACKAAGTLEQHQLIPPKPRATLTQKSLQRRSKNSERSIARRMSDIDGPDPNFVSIASSTGRVGHITNMRIDTISKHYVVENKNRVLPKWLGDAWLLINQRSIDFGKHALLHIEAPNNPKDFPLNGKRYKLGTMAIITQDRHEELITKERELEELTRR